MTPSALLSTCCLVGGTTLQQQTFCTEDEHPMNCSSDVVNSSLLLSEFCFNLRKC